LFFWGTLCWCTTKIKRLVGGPIWPFLQLSRPYHSLICRATLT
jgi:hypothetical protein